MAEITADQRTIEYAQERLEEWGQWLRSLRGVQLGYSSHASFVSEPGGGDGQLDEIGNERAEEVERIMCKMRQLRPTLHQAMVQWYLLRKPSAVSAQACHCAVSVFRDRVRTGEMFVAGRLLG